ncbi:MAG: LUD domain-containing protein [Peptococcaceae bacterium]|nr:LUD domain-containing protein [Peptococcaceae bacterium]
MYKDKLADRIARGLADGTAYRGRRLAFDLIRPKTAMLREKYAGLSEKARLIKERALDQNNVLLERAVRKMRENGFQVFLAVDARQALDYICSVISEGPVVKSKSNAGKEIGLRGALEDRGLEVVETDLGDRLCQLSGTRPSHPLAPALHLTVETIAEIIAREEGGLLPPEPGILVGAARRSLRSKLLGARGGISGANAISADTGSVFLTENEGNIRAVTSLPPKHVVVAGIEKIVPTLEDAYHLVRAAAIYGGANEIGTYISVISGIGRRPGNGPGIYGGFGPQEVHVVLLDNGRRRTMEAGFTEALYCLNCGACLNHCPVYGEIGDHYGGKHLGGRGVVMAACQEGLEAAVEAGLSLCINCRSCVEVCPVKINTPGLITRLRELALTLQPPPAAARLVLRKIIAGDRTGLAYGAGKRLQGLLCRKEGSGQRLKLPNKVWPDRLLPRLAPRPLTSLLNRSRAAAGRKVIFFAGCMINYFYPEIGVAAAQLLRLSGVDVVTPPALACCGMPLLAHGYLEEARNLALHNLALLADAGVQDIVTCCPTCGGALQREYPALLAGRQGGRAGEAALRLGERVRDISQFVLDELPESIFSSPLNLRVTYHDPCHLCRGMGVTKPPRELIRRLPGVELKEMYEPDTCCGCGGSFSLEHYTLASRINDRKVDNIKATEAAVLVTGCPACMAHFRDGLARRGCPQQVVHLAQLLAAGCGLGKEGGFVGG